MDKDDKYPEFAPGSGDSEEVEILEVVGVDTDGASSPGSRAISPDAGSDDPDEYLLDFDEAERGMSADATTPGSGNAAGAEVGESDHQRLLRVRADYDNLRKRIDRERREFHLHANCELVGRLLPVVDNLERALATDDYEGLEGTLHEGLTMIYRQLMDQLRQEGLKPIEALGQPFDPNRHDAVATDRTSPEPANTVVEELQKGYLFQGRVLRPSMVSVSTGDGRSGEDA
jgi:molecular chaperone GrpE